MQQHKIEVSHSNRSFSFAVFIRNLVLTQTIDLLDQEKILIETKIPIRIERKIHTATKIHIETKIRIVKKNHRRRIARTSPMEVQRIGLLRTNIIRYSLPFGILIEHKQMSKKNFEAFEISFAKEQVNQSRCFDFTVARFLYLEKFIWNLIFVPRFEHQLWNSPRTDRNTDCSSFTVDYRVFRRWCWYHSILRRSKFFSRFFFRKMYSFLHF